MDDSCNLLKTIDIYNSNGLQQRILANKIVERKQFQLIDCNFDGFKDISVLRSCGSGGCTYYIWNYSATEHRFFYNKELSEVLGLEIDTIGKYVVFHYRAGYAEEIWDSLQYQNNKLQFVKGLYQERWHDSIGNAWVKKKYSKVINQVTITKIDSFITQ